MQLSLIFIHKIEFKGQSEPSTCNHNNEISTGCYSISLLLNKHNLEFNKKDEFESNRQTTHFSSNQICPTG